MEESRVGEVVKVYENLGVAVVKLYSNLALGDRLHFRGQQTDFEQGLDSMENNGARVEDASMGMEVGIKTSETAQEGDMVFKVME